MKIFYKGKDISILITKLTWSGSRLQVARKLIFDYIRDGQDPNIPVIMINTGETILGYDDNKNLIFQGNIFDVDANWQDGNVEITAYDNLFILTKSKTSRHITNETPESVAGSICSEMGIKAGTIAQTGIPVTFIADKKPGYEIIMMAYTEASKKNDKKYHPVMTGDKLDIIEKGALIENYVADSHINILESSYKESIENIVNAVMITDQQGNMTGYMTDDDSIKKYSMIQDVYKTDPNKNTQESAKALFKKPERLGYITVIGDYRLKSSYSLQIKDGLFNGQFWIKADTHTFEDGKYITKLELEFENIMNEEKADKENAASTGSGDVNAGIDSGWSAWGGQTMVNGSNGCAEAAGKIGSYYSPFLAQECNNDVVYVPTLVSDADSAGLLQPFNESTLEKGDVIVYGDNQHVVIYDGNGGYYGNSSSQDKIVHGGDYTAMEYQPTKIIKTSKG